MSANTHAEASEGASGAQNAPETPSRDSAQVVVHPFTGEIIRELDTQPPETLAEVYAAVIEAQARLKVARDALKRELQARLAVRGVARWTVGDWEIGESVGKRSHWDGDALEQVVRELIDAGAITARDVTDLIRHETKVDGNAANRLSRRLVGANKAAVENCRTWESTRRDFDVVRSLPLVADE